MLPLACTVRQCGLPLERRTASFVCPRGHSYDIARSGYVNLLQPQDRRSKLPGDAKDAVAARARLMGSGVAAQAYAAMVQRIAAIDHGEMPVIVDLGSGTGDALAQLAARRAIAGIGIDLSTAAAELAARRFPHLSWVVANADRRLPLLDRSVDVVLTLHGRRNPREAARILKGSGTLLGAVPAADDLVELRQFVQGEGVARDRITTLLAEHESQFVVVDRFEARACVQLDRATLVDLLRTTYRGARRREAERAAKLDSLQVTMASECVVMRPR